MFRKESSIIDLPETSLDWKKSGYVSGGCNSINAFQKCSKYFYRLFRFDHMDFEFAFWQMIYLFYNPKKVYDF